MAKKKRGTRREAASTSTKASTNTKKRHRSWTTVTFDELDARRSERNIPKKKMADMLGVTNSTYHNWARGIAVATPNTQERIRRWIDSNGASGGTPIGSSGQPRPTTPPASHSEIMETTGRVVESYLQTKPSGMSVERLVKLVRDVRQALTE